MTTGQSLHRAGTDAGTQTTDTVTAPARPDVRSLSIRELLVALTEVENELRATPFLVPGQVGSRVNPSVGPLLARQRAIVAQLRARRVSWSAPPVEPRARSAAWPPPPWD